MTPSMICPRCWGSGREPLRDNSCTFCLGHGHAEDLVLSPHFRLSELLVSETAVRLGLPNDPPDGFVERLRQVAEDLLEPIRARFGAIHVNSGYRSPAVNHAIGGSKTSAHMEGWAADLKPMEPGVTRKAIADFVVASEIPFDQVIFEGTWVHVGRFSAAGGVRREALMMFPGAHGPAYFPYDPADPRVRT